MAVDCSLDSHLHKHFILPYPHTFKRFLKPNLKEWMVNKSCFAAWVEHTT